MAPCPLPWAGACSPPGNRGHVFLRTSICGIGQLTCHTCPRLSVAGMLCCRLISAFMSLLFGGTLLIRRAPDGSPLQELPWVTSGRPPIHHLGRRRVAAGPSNYEAWDMNSPSLLLRQVILLVQVISSQIYSSIVQEIVKKLLGPIARSVVNICRG